MDMPTKKRRTAAAQAAARGPLPEVPAELLDHLVKGPMTPSEVQDLFLSFQKAVIERTMVAEMNLHLRYRPGQDKPEDQAQRAQRRQRQDGADRAWPGARGAAARPGRLLRPDPDPQPRAALYRVR